MFCKKCGNKIPDGAHICGLCGERNDSKKTETTTTTKKATTTTKNNSNTSTGWKKAYKDYLNNYLKNNSDSGEASFNLIYLDNSGIPQLAVSPTSAHYGNAELVVYDGSSAKKIGEYGEFGVFSYEEKTGIIIDRYMGQGNGYVTVYSLNGTSVSKKWEVNSKEVYDNETGEAKTVYKSNGKAVSEDEYNSQFNKYVPINLSVTGEGAKKLTAENINNI